MTIFSTFPSIVSLSGISPNRRKLTMQVLDAFSIVGLPPQQGKRALGPFSIVSISGARA